MNHVAVDKITVDQKVKLLQLSLYYVLPKLTITKTKEKKYEDGPIFIEVFQQKDSEQGTENWQDNF